MTNSTNSLQPVSSSERFVVLDALRGFAILGICMANFPEFSLYTFLEEGVAELMATAGIDRIAKYFLSIFIDGKFYSIFSLLFGIGFSIIISNALRKGVNAFRIFYRRMFFLFLIGFLHLILVWSGDILMLYALMGMILPLFTRLSDKGLITWAAVLLFLPVIVDFVCESLGISLSKNLMELQWYYCGQYGITADNFAYWLRDAQNYNDVLKFLVQGAFERMQEFVDGNRYFKVLGLFLIGYYIGRNKIFANLESRRSWLIRLSKTGWFVGLPLSIVYAYSSIEGHPWGWGVHSLLYFISVYITSFGYIATFCLMYLKFRNGWCWKVLAAPGKMALTNYIGQSVAGMFIFYGIGLTFGASTGLIYVELIAIGVFIVEIIFSISWTRFFRFGPLEWIWRCCTYGRLFSIGRQVT
ncbi:MAG: DUF418 domain-containing protein [Muribaculaceae bacterium]|nr:DUF418 domain-containing protein [Muribaculaceae bacterium]